MDRPNALSDLKSENPRIRLTAARFLVRTSTGEDLPVLRSALQAENVAWVRNALGQAIRRAQDDTSDDEKADNSSWESDDTAEARASAIIQVTSELLHELEPLVGVLRLRLITEWPDFEASHSEKALEQIENFLTALSEMNAAAHVPTFEDFSLREAVEQVMDEIPHDLRVPISMAGPDTVVRSNRALVQLILRNGVRNAQEATAADASPRIVVTWGASEGGGFFLAVLDDGPGPPTGAELHAFDVGTSTKRGHLGMGLAVANRAAESLGGVLSLRHGASGGAVLRFSSQRIDE